MFVMFVLQTAMLVGSCVITLKILAMVVAKSDKSEGGEEVLALSLLEVGCLGELSTSVKIGANWGVREVD